MKTLYYENKGWYGHISYSTAQNRYKASTGENMSMCDTLKEAKAFMAKHGYEHNPGGSQADRELSVCGVCLS